MRRARQTIGPKLWLAIWLGTLVGSVLIGIIATVVLRLFAAPPVADDILLLVLAGLNFLVFVTGLVFWRCPVCDGLLPISGMLGAEYCPLCGSELSRPVL